MTGTVAGPAKRPCASCPYRVDVPSGVWSREDYLKLPPYDGETFEQPTGMFQCHQTDLEDDRARLCAGWVAVNNRLHAHADDESGGVFELLSVRLAGLNDGLDEQTLDTLGEYSTEVPLFSSGAEACAHGLTDLATPSDAALAVQAKIQRKRDL